MCKFLFNFVHKKRVVGRGEQKDKTSGRGFTFVCCFQLALQHQKNASFYCPAIVFLLFFVEYRRLFFFVVFRFSFCFFSEWFVLRWFILVFYVVCISENLVKYPKGVLLLPTDETVLTLPRKETREGVFVFFFVFFFLFSLYATQNDALFCLTQRRGRSKRKEKRKKT